MYVIIRTENAGVFAGSLVSYREDSRHADLTDARRLWYWDGAATLSELATSGTSKPDGCKFPAVVSRITLAQVIEIIEVTDAARKSIEETPVWAA